MLISMALLGVMASIDPLRPVVFAMVLSTRRSNAIAFLAGWAAALVLLFGLAFVLLGGDTTTSSEPTEHAWVSVLVLAIGGGLLAIAARRWRHRNDDAARRVVPRRLLDVLGNLDPRRAVVLGILIQPRMVTVAAALVCARDRTDALDLVVGFVLFGAASTGALIALFAYDILRPEASRLRLAKIVESIEREGPRLVTIASALAGTYLIANSLVTLVSS